MTDEKYLWLGDDSQSDEDKHEIAKKLMGDTLNENYIEPVRDYDETLEATEEYIASLPDLQNGPSSLIQGSKTELNQVGIHNFRLPIRYSKKCGGVIELETSVTGSVSLEAHKKGINMSRIMRSFYEYKDEIFILHMLEEVLKNYKNKLGSFDASLQMAFSYPIIQKSLRSGNEGWQYYDVVLESILDKNGILNKIIHFDFVYSSACPCSYELSQHAMQYRNKAVVPHSQRSVARVSLNCSDIIWIEDIKDLCAEALQTETQVIVKREDEQAFAELNGSNLKFVEDAARLLHEKFDNLDGVIDFKIIASHNESLHSHNAVACVVKGIHGGFTPDVSRDTWQSLGLR